LLTLIFIIGTALWALPVLASAPNSPSGLSALSTQARPTLNWARGADAAWYRVLITVSTTGQPIYDQWFQVEESLCTDQVCTLSPDLYLSPGQYWFQAQAWSPNGLSRLSVPVEFGVPFPPEPANRLLSEVSDNGRLALSWIRDVDAEWYQVWIGTTDFQQTYYQQWHPVADLGCADSLRCTLVLENGIDLQLANGLYTWFVQAYGPGGFSTGGYLNTGWVQGPVFSIRR
jgi:hypothetical protein